MIEKSILKEFFYLRDKIIEYRYKELNEEQLRAVLSNNRNLAVIACPGAGKTTTLIRKVDYLVTFGPIYKTKYYPESLNKEDIEILKEYIDYNKVNKRLNFLLRQKAINPNNIM
ncbi:UvrD-helicase domain-containing protein, partial [Clostridium botulinum]